MILTTTADVAIALVGVVLAVVAWLSASVINLLERVARLEQRDKDNRDLKTR